MTSQKVRPGCEDDYGRWQDRTNEVAGEFAGFEGTEQYPPASADENEWVVVFRFSHLDQLTAWMDSDTRRELLEQGSALFEEPPTQEVLAGGTPVRDAVTAVISHNVRPEQEAAFMGWQEKILAAQREFPGFMGSELFRPVKGVQDKWVTAFRFDTRQHLDDWLGSTTRQKLLDEGRAAFVSYDVRKVGSAFGTWFRFEQGAEDGGAPPNWKQALSVVLALYPNVKILGLTVGDQFDDAGMPGYLSLFISNVLSVSILTWLLMPLVNRAFAFWLMPSRPSVRNDIAGAAVVAICWLAFIVIFGLTTG